MRKFRSGRRGDHSYDSLDTSESGEVSTTKNIKEFGFERVKWTRLSGDVFKPPRCRMLFSALIGFGA